MTAQSHAVHKFNVLVAKRKSQMRLGTTNVSMETLSRRTQFNNRKLPDTKQTITQQI
jgi:hypothetical protein